MFALHIEGRVRPVTQLNNDSKDSSSGQIVPLKNSRHICFAYRMAIPTSGKSWSEQPFANVLILACDKSVI